MDSIEGVDYIFDRYTFLQRIVYENAARQVFKNDIKAIDESMARSHLPFAEYIGTLAGNHAEDICGRIFPVDANAPVENIERALRAGRAAVHPDRFNNVALDVLRDAERQREALDQCEEILLDETKRNAFNTLLDKFRREKPRFISRDGHGIIDLSSERLLIDDLLDDQTPDMSGYEHQADQMIQFSESRLQDMKTLYEMAPENLLFRKLYKEELSKKLVHCQILETSGWARLGYMNKTKNTAGHVLQAGHYARQVEDEIQRVRNEAVDDAISERSGALALGFGKPFLLLGNGEAGTAASSPDEKERQRIAEKARKNLDLKAEFLRRAAMNKQAVLEELTTLTDIEDVTPRDLENPNYRVLIVQPNDKRIVLGQLTIDAQTGKGGLETSFPGQGGPLADLPAHLPETARNIVAVIRNPEITDILLEANHVAQNLCDDWEKAHEAAPGISSQPSP